ncbi:MAG: hypothetical protein Q9184_008296, partial [Pyrenodesmia sp. 2 TL-2023]
MPIPQPQLTKRPLNTTSDEVNKRRRLNPHPSSPARNDIIINAPHRRAHNNTPNQPTPREEEPLDDLAEQEEAENLDLEEKQALRRLEAIRARKKSLQLQKARATLGLNPPPPVTPTPSHRLPVTPSQGPRTSDRQVGSSFFQPTDVDPAPGRSQEETVSIKHELYEDILPARRVSSPTAPTRSRPAAVSSSSRPICRRSASLPQDGARAATASAPASTGPAFVKSAATKPPSTIPRAAKPAATKPPSHPTTVPTTGKRAHQDVTADTFDEYDYYAYGHGSQRRKLSDGRSSPILPPISSTPEPSEPQRK